ncbi:hypothetical protein FKP32DRAFT_1590116 [Trametes sanguinea]|nr:hypothetical protein FKP32DRAFT_1590116 [Trametes sanguinea]
MASHSVQSPSAEDSKQSLSSGTVATTFRGNLDTLRRVLEYLPQQELLTMSRVSRLFRDEACHQFLTRPICLHGPRELLSFNQAIQWFGISQLSLVRTLTIEHIDMNVMGDEVATAAFFEVVTNCTHLQSLELLQCLAVIKDEARIVNTLSSFRSLTRFVVRDPFMSGPLTSIIHRAVLSMKCALKELHLPLIPYARPPLDLRALAQAQPYVKKLGDLWTLATLDIPWLSVRTLRMTFDEGVSSAADIHAAFPNLQHLETSTRNEIDLEDYPESLEPSRHGSGWTSLLSLRSSVPVIYAMGLVSPVRDLDLDSDSYQANLHTRIIQVLGRLRPRKLTLSLFCAPRMPIAVPLNEPHILTYDAKGTGVRYLHLHISFYSHIPHNADVLLYVLPFLCHSRVKFLQLTISPYDIWGNEPEDIVNPVRTFHLDPELAEVAEAIQVEALVQELAAPGRCPSLCALSTTIFKGEHIVWRIAREDGTHHLERLRPSDGRLLMQREHERCFLDDEEESG